MEREVRRGEGAEEGDWEREGRQGRWKTGVGSRCSQGGGKSTREESDQGKPVLTHDPASYDTGSWKILRHLCTGGCTCARMGFVSQLHSLLFSSPYLLPTNCRYLWQNWWWQHLLFLLWYFFSSTLNNAEGLTLKSNAYAKKKERTRKQNKNNACQLKKVWESAEKISLNKRITPLLQHPYIFGPWCTNVAP